MKRFAILFLAAALTITSCKKEDNTPDKVDTVFEPTADDVLVSTGTFQNEVHPTSGTVKLYRNDSEYTLRIENLTSDNGPDLKVYLSPDKSGSPFINLGNLKAINGSFSYTFDLSTDVDNNPYVLIWCEDFGVLFGSAKLE